MRTAVYSKRAPLAVSVASQVRDEDAIASLFPKGAHAPRELSDFFELRADHERRSNCQEHIRVSLDTKLFDRVTVCTDCLLPALRCRTCRIQVRAQLQEIDSALRYLLVHFDAAHTQCAFCTSRRVTVEQPLPQWVQRIEQIRDAEITNDFSHSFMLKMSEVLAFSLFARSRCALRCDIMRALMRPVVSNSMVMGWLEDYVRNDDNEVETARQYLASGVLRNIRNLAPTTESVTQLDLQGVLAISRITCTVWSEKGQTRVPDDAVAFYFSADDDAWPQSIRPTISNHFARIRALLYVTPYVRSLFRIDEVSEFIMPIVSMDNKLEPVITVAFRSLITPLCLRYFALPALLPLRTHAVYPILFELFATSTLRANAFLPACAAQIALAACVHSFCAAVPLDYSQLSPATAFEINDTLYPILLAARQYMHGDGAHLGSLDAGSHEPDMILACSWSVNIRWILHFMLVPIRKYWVGEHALALFSSLDSYFSEDDSISALFQSQALVERDCLINFFVRWALRDNHGLFVIAMRRCVAACTLLGSVALDTLTHFEYDPAIEHTPRTVRPAESEPFGSRFDSRMMFQPQKATLVTYLFNDSKQWREAAAGVPMAWMELLGFLELGDQYYTLHSEWKGTFATHCSHMIVQSEHGAMQWRPILLATSTSFDTPLPSDILMETHFGALPPSVLHGARMELYKHTVETSHRIKLVKQVRWNDETSYREIEACGKVDYASVVEEDLARQTDEKYMRERDYELV